MGGGPLPGEHAGKAQLVLARGEPALGLRLGQAPEPPRGCVLFHADHAVEAVRALGPALDVALVAEDLQVPAHRGLGELEDLAELGHPQLVAFEKAQEAQARGLGQAPHPGEKGFRLASRHGGCYHHSIRLEG